MRINRIKFPGVRSICWSGDNLVDWVAGGSHVSLDGVVQNACVIYGYRFDSARQTECGRYAVIYENLGTKGLVLDNGQIVREINRSFYHADCYEYPIAVFVDSNNIPLIYHCPNDYNVLVLENLLTGEVISGGVERNSPDFFHSRLQVSKNMKWLLSAGWLWHPFDYLSVHHVITSERGTLCLDKPIALAHINGEVVSADFLPHDKLLVATSDESLDEEDVSAEEIGPNTISVVNLNDGKLESSITVEEKFGKISVLDENCFLSFYGHPKLVSIISGEVLHRWSEIDSGQQQSSILLNAEPLPPLAIDTENRRFAVGCGDFVDIVCDIKYS